MRARLFLALLVLLTAAITGLPPATAAAAPHTAFPCDNTYYLLTPDPGGSVLGKVVFPGSGQGRFDPIRKAPFRFNALGFNHRDGLIYGVANVDTGDQVFRVGSEGSFELLGPPVTPDGQPAAGFSAFTGAFLADGSFAVANEGSRTYVLDVTQTPPRVLSGPSNANIDTNDWAVNPIDDAVYSFDRATSQILRVDPGTGATSPAGGAGYPGQPLRQNGSAWIDGTGQLTFAGGYNDDAGQIHFFRADFNPNTHRYGPIRYLGEQPELGASGDGASCAFAMDLAKASDTTPAAPAPAGSTTTFHFTATNGSGVDQTFDFHDAFPPYLTYQAVRFTGGGTPGTVQSNGTDVTITGLGLTAGATMTFDVDVLVAPGAVAGTEYNSATLTGAQLPPGGVTSHLPNSDSFDPTPTPVYLRAGQDLALSKTVQGPGHVLPGDQVTIHTTVTDPGGNGAGAWSVQETLPPGFDPTNAAGACSLSGGGVQWAGGSFPAGGTSTCDLTVRVAASERPGNYLNAANLTAGGDTNNTNNDAQVVVSVTALPTVDLAITDTAPAQVPASGQFDYTLTIANQGQATATGVVVTDVLAPGVQFLSASAGGTSNGQNVQWTLGALGQGQQTQLTVHVQAPPTPGHLDNAATVAVTGGGPADNNPDNNTATAGTDVTGVADVFVQKTGPATVLAGGTFRYTFVVGNNGPSTATGVVLTDPLPAGTTYVGASDTVEANGGVLVWRLPAVAPGDARQLTVDLTAPGETVRLANTASVAAGEPDPVPANNTSATVFTDVTPVADLVVAKAGPATVSASGQVTYAVTASNAGPSTVANVLVSDRLPAGTTFVSADNGGVLEDGVVVWRLPSLANGAAVTLTLVVSAPPEAGRLENTATVTADAPDPNPANNTSTTVRTDVTAVADVYVQKAAPPSVPALGQISYTLTVGNNGPSTATGTTVSDPVPGGTTFVSADGGGVLQGGTVVWSIPSLAPGATASLTVVVTAPPEPGTVSNTASVAADTPDPNPVNNTSTRVTTEVTPIADVFVGKVGPAQVDASTAITYTLTVGDNGPSTATGVVVSDPLPPGTAFVSAGNGGTLQNGVVVWSVGTIAPGGTQQLTFVVTAPSDTSTVTNVATVTGQRPDPNQANNTSQTVQTAVIPVADVAVAVHGPPFAEAGSTFEWTVTVTNAGPSVAHDVVATTSPDGATATTWPLGDVAPGAVVTRTALVTAPMQAGTAHDVADVTTSTKDPVAANNHAEADAPIRGFTLAKTVQGNGSARTGDQVTYTIVATNGSTVPYDDGTGLATFTDDLSGVTDDAALDSAVAHSGTVTPEGAGFRWQGPIPAGGTAVVTVTVVVGNPVGGGDHLLRNTVAGGTNCPAGPACTPPPVEVRGIGLVKTASTAVVHPDEPITFTVEIRNTGGHAFTVADPAVVTDDLTRVLDDADYTDATTDAGTVAVSAPVLTWTGPLGLGDVVHVSYTLTVRNPQTGDGSLDNAVASVEEPDCPCGTQGGSPLVQAYLLNKSVDRSGGVKPGEEVTYTITVTNSGRVPYGDGEATFTEDLTGVVDDAEVEVDKLATDTGTLDWQEDKLVWAGALPVVYPDKTPGATITVTVRVLDPDLSGDHELTNAVTGSANCPPPSPDPVCTAGDPLPISGLTVHKTASAPTAHPGDVITYTITVANTGKVDFTDDDPAVVTDDLSKVLDDAASTGDPTADTGAVTYAEPVLTWQGALVQGATATITYQVTVAKHGTGDHVLTNVAQAPSSNCVPALPDPSCGGTVRAAELHIEKKANAEQVTDGDTLRYTITVTNVGAVDYDAATFTDDLTGVLDDADYRGDARATAGKATYAEPKLTWTGPVPVGGSVRVTYSVRVNGPDKGDRKLTNVVGAADSNCPCKVTTRTIAAQSGGLAFTGVWLGRYLAGGAALLLLGIVFLTAARIRRTR